MAANPLNILRIDHIGSMVRPAQLKEIFARFDRGQATKEALTQAQDQAIRDVIPAGKPRLSRRHRRRVSPP